MPRMIWQRLAYGWTARVTVAAVTITIAAVLLVLPLILGPRLPGR